MRIKEIVYMSSMMSSILVFYMKSNLFIYPKETFEYNLEQDHKKIDIKVKDVYFYKKDKCQLSEYDRFDTLWTWFLMD